MCWRECHRQCNRHDFIAPKLCSAFTKYIDEDAQYYISILEKVCMHSKLDLSIAPKQRIYFVKARNKDKPCIAYNNKKSQLQTLESFEHLILEVPPPIIDRIDVLSP